MYLGYLGYKTANVPIVKGIKPPKELFEVDGARIVGLTIEAERLAEIRQERAKRLGGSSHRNYTALMAIYEELDEAAAIQRKLGAPVIDTTELSIEETASRVIRLVEHRLHDQQKAKAKAE
jgi:regulator of PEP synthase PpsR (kinase-PPPase family)